MTNGDIKAHVEKIRRHAQSGDHEAAHSLEDKLYRYVLRMIANGDGGEAGLLAEEALKSQRIKFYRFCV